MNQFGLVRDLQDAAGVCFVAGTIGTASIIFGKNPWWLGSGISLMILGAIFYAIAKYMRIRAREDEK